MQYSPITLKRMVLMDQGLPHSVKQVYLAQIDAVDRPAGIAPSDLAGIGFGGIAGWLGARSLGMGGVGRITAALLGGLAGKNLLAPHDPAADNDHGTPNFRIPS